MSTPDSPGSDAALSSTSSTAVAAKPVSNPLIVMLLVIIAILLAVIAGLIATRPSGTQAGVPATADAGSTQVAGPDTGGAASGTSETAAPTVTDPATLETMRSEVTRDPDDARAQGDVDAAVVMVLYSDFACPYCTLLAQEVEPGLADLVKDGTLRIEWRDLAQITETSPLAAQAGIAAANQGRFWEFHDAVYGAADPSSHPVYSEDSLVAFAEQAGVGDLARFRTDMTAQTTVDAVESAKQRAYALGITGTPFMIIGDAFIGGYMDADYVRATIEDQAARAGQAG